MMSTHKFLLITLLVILVCAPGGAFAFGAGNIPSFAYLEGRAFRHGDIEDVLAELLKRTGTGLLSRGSKFGGLDIKRVYFGNWLRDYSQAVDILALKKLGGLQPIINLVMVLGFLAHGYATAEFEVTEERLGAYLPTEHIDNPKGYGEGEDPRRFHPKLRGPVDPRELEVDPQSGMKNYIANEMGSWDTSKALVRRTLERCIELGRKHHVSKAKQDQYEAFRLLGEAMHTLEDFAAHSNFCELALVSLGHSNVFVHVGDQVKIHAPNGKWVAPLVTGTFGGADFMHSLLGEATDHISQASVSDLNQEIEKARIKSMDGSCNIGAIRALVTQIPGSNDGEISRDLDSMERIRAGEGTDGKKPEQMSAKELHATLWKVLVIRDRIAKKIDHIIEGIPGLGPLLERFMESIQVWVFTTLEPYLKPIMKAATGALQTSSAEVIDKHDQYEVFNDPRASDPTHSFLSKDHFNLILNEPAGNIAKIIVIHTVKSVVNAWDNNSVSPRSVTEDVLQCLFHPDFHNSNSALQREMLQYMRTWAQHVKHDVFDRLTKDAVRNHRNIRPTGAPEGPGVSAHTHGQGIAASAQGKIQGMMNHIPGMHQAQQFMGSVGGYAMGTAPGQKRDDGGGHGHGGGEAASYYGNTRSPSLPSGPPNPSHGVPNPSAGGFPAPSGPPSNAPPHMPASSPMGGFPSAADPFPSAANPFPSAADPFPSPYGAPSSGPSFPGGAPGFPGGPAAHSSYPHSEGPDYNSPGFPSFPGGPQGFPGAGPEFPGGSAFPGGPGFPGGPAFPGGPDFPGGPPQFPSDNAPPQFPSDNAPPQFPGAGSTYPGQHGYGGSGW